MTMANDVPKVFAIMQHQKLWKLEWPKNQNIFFWKTLFLART
jgi:hypothetical protein